MEILQYNSVIILTYLFVSLIILLINKITGDKLNLYLFSCYRSSLLNPLTYVRLLTHVLGHNSWTHFMNNFIYILLVGPMIEEKIGSINLLIMMVITAIVIGIIHLIFSRKRILGASGIVYMLITFSSATNIITGKIPMTLILICLFYIINEIYNSIVKKDNVSHLSHLVGIMCGIIFIFI